MKSTGVVTNSYFLGGGGGRFDLDHGLDHYVQGLSWPLCSRPGNPVKITYLTNIVTMVTTIKEVTNGKVIRF